MNKQITRIVSLAVVSSLIFNTGCSQIRDKSYMAVADRNAASIVHQAAVDNKKLQQVNKRQAPKAVIASLMPENILSRQVMQHSKRKYNIVANNVAVKEFFLGLVDGTKFNVAIHPNINGNVSLNIKNVTMSEVLDVLQQMYNYDYKITGNNIQVLPAILTTKSFEINYLDLQRMGQSDIRVDAGNESSDNNSNNSNNTNNSSSNNNSNSSNSSNNNTSIKSKVITTSKTDFWTNIEKNIAMIIGGGSGRQVTVNPLSGLAVVTAMPKELHMVATFINKAEAALIRQVILETKIIEIELSDAFQAGIDWSWNTGNSVFTQVGAQALAVTKIPNITGLATNKVFTIDNEFGDSFKPVLEMLSTQGNVKVLSSPRISTTNNQKALIKIGEDKSFVTDISSTTTTSVGGSTTAPTVTSKNFFSGISLDITPQISANNDVILHVHPTISSVTSSNDEIMLAGQKQTVPTVINTVRESDSIVRAKNGQVVVIGGLMEETTLKVITGVPILKNLPGIGVLFRNTRETIKKKELVILLKPTVVEDGSWLAELSNTANRIKRNNDYFNNNVTGGSGFIGY